MKLKIRDGRYWIHGTCGLKKVGDKEKGNFLRLPLGTSNKSAASVTVDHVERALAEGHTSPRWPELKKILPPKTFDKLAEVGNYHEPEPEPEAAPLPTWADLCTLNELDMERQIANKARGATPEEGIMSESTRVRYRQTIRHFNTFLVDMNTPLESIASVTIEKFKIDRYKKITALKQSRGGGSIALDVAVLHRIFNLAVTRKLMAQNPIDLSKESKPGKNPKNGARPLTGDELKKLREVAGKDLFMFLLLRWSEIHFDRGVNGEIEKLTQKRGKVAIIPLSTELRETLEAEYSRTNPKLDDLVLLNSADDLPFSDRQRMYERIRAMGRRAGMKRLTPHYFRDTFACDMLARGVGIFEVAKMLADTVDTVEKHYAEFIPAARDGVQARMDAGIGIEEQSRLAAQRGRKIVAIRG